LRQLLEHIKKYPVFYGLSMGFILIGLFSLLKFAKGDVVLIFNRNQSELFNLVFLYLTKLGELMGGALVFLILIFTSKYKYSVIFLVAVLFSSVASQGLKRGVFGEEKRPSHMFSQLNPIEDLERHTNFSFPSGHTTAAFTFFSVLSFALVRKRYQFIAALAAISVGVSRVYLGQHFVNDVIAGAVLGTLLSTVCFILLEKRLSSIPFLEQKLINYK
jgi:membrane-associated phospholipid phosphatase